MYLPEGCAKPNVAELNAFWQRTNPGGDFQVRWIGLARDSTEEVLDLIAVGDKTGTFTLPWIVERTEQPVPAVGDRIVLIDFDGHPRLSIRLTDIELVPFGGVTAAHTSIDGSPVRDLAIWKPLHTKYWNAMLMPFGLAVSDAMPVWIERFELPRSN